MLEWGYSAAEIAAVFDGGGDESVQARVRIAMRVLGETLAQGVIDSWTRPMGGGDPARLKASAWELDDFNLRFATSGCDPQRLFDSDVPPTHWIFLDLEMWNTFIEKVTGFTPSRVVPARPSPPASALAAVSPSSREGNEDRLIRLDEVKRRTGLSRSTIYRRMENGLFPRTVPMTGSVAAWREHEVDDWVADPR